MKILNFKLRPLKRSDFNLILTWRNHETVRLFSRDRSTISHREHLDWCADHSDLCRLIFEYQGRRAGFIKIDRDGFWSFYLKPSLIKKGLSKVMLQLALLYARQLELNEINALVHSANKVSLKLHRHFGFIQKSKQNEFKRLTRRF
jgi:RimJ/RimL family protein N-acetyltransferase